MYEQIDRASIAISEAEATSFAFWRRIDRPGHDAATTARSGRGWLLTGVAAFDERGPTGLRYQLELAADFSTQSATIEGFRSGQHFVHSFKHAAAGWYIDRKLVPELDDLVHLDFGFTPSTNRQQLCHAALEVGDEAEIPAAWFDIGETGLVRLPQLYRRLSGDRYFYSSPTTGYEAVLELAPNGFTRLYPGLWEMEHSN